MEKIQDILKRNQEELKIKSSIKALVGVVDEILTRYIEDEAGQESKDKYNNMTKGEKLMLLTNTICTCAGWEDFEASVVINFDYCNY